MIDEKPKNETEILSADEKKLREMCIALKKVDAPADFEFKLKARIAGSKAKDFQPRFGFAFRYALPVLGLILVFGLLVYTGIFRSKDNSTIAESSAVSQVPALPQNVENSNVSSPEVLSNQSLAVVSSNRNLPKISEKPQPQTTENTPRIPKKNSRLDNSGGGSKLSAGRESETLFPRGFDPKNIPLTQPNNEKPTTALVVKDLLSMIGVNASFENGKWTVKTVSANGPAGVSGVKENDVIEAVDNQTLSAETINSKTFSVKTITVMRNGEKLQIKLRNK